MVRMFHDFEIKKFIEFIKILERIDRRIKLRDSRSLSKRMTENPHKHETDKSIISRHKRNIKISRPDN